MPKYTKEDLHRIIEEKDIRFLRLQFTDVFGILKNITVTTSRLDKVIDEGCMFDGSSIDGFARIEESDMMLVPDLDTFEIFPWSNPKGRTARFICDVYTPDGKPYSGCPRSILKQQLKIAADMGYTLNIGPECEFFLFHKDDNNKVVLETNDDGGYFDLAPLDTGGGARRDICLALEEMGFEIEASHHECAAGQHEIDFKYGDALKMADDVMTFKIVVKRIAQTHGLHATFMPKPIFGIAGSGMHINMSLCNKAGNAFCDESDELGLSKVAYGFMAGVLNHARGLSLI
ncbi:MAG: glutamine synthetase family protein, partial [Christensenellaceae bacterium]